MNKLTKVFACTGILLLFGLSVKADGGRILRYIYCSDLHYGLEREFRGKTVKSDEVNRAMFDAFRLLRDTQLPADSGVGAGIMFGKPDFIVCTGDIANRMEDGVQTAGQSWSEFERDLKESSDVPLYLVPGNHDISNAIGYPDPLTPDSDASSASAIFNAMMHPDTLRTPATFSYAKDKVHYSFIMSGIRFVFVGLWFDEPMRRWFDGVIGNDSLMPTVVFTHDPPEADAKHFTNPNGRHDMNQIDKFQNLLADTATVSDVKCNPEGNWRQLENFLKAHPGIKAYFHGDKNYNEFYTWHGVDGTISLPVFRVDSPMKGEYSATDERLLSFIVVTVDIERRLLTARECFWNKSNQTSIKWGTVKTIKL